MNETPIIIGITGTLGAGKGTIVDYLIQKKGFIHYSVRNYLTGILEKRELTINRDRLVALANELRNKHGSDYIVKQLYKKATKVNKASIIESIRTTGEVNALKKNKNFYLLAVDAKPKVRYQRIIKRGSATDKITYQKFLADEKFETTSQNPNDSNIIKVMKMADFKFENNGKIKDLYNQVDKAFNEIESKK